MLTGFVRPLHCAAMAKKWTWASLRTRFIATREQLPGPKQYRSQAAVAKRAGLGHQSAISKIELNDTLGPAVEVFLNALEGLDQKPSEFFAKCEKVQNQGLPLGAASVTSGPSQGKAGHGASPIQTWRSLKADLERVRQQADAIRAELDQLARRDRRSSKARRKKASGS